MNEIVRTPPPSSDDFQQVVKALDRVALTLSDIEVQLSCMAVMFEKILSLPAGDGNGAIRIRTIDDEAD